jgi:serine acetyltransferase
MIIKNDKTIAIIGYPESAMTQNYFYFISRKTKNIIEILSPDEFFNIENKNYYQYSVGFSLDMNLRSRVCDYIDNNNLDCFTYIDDTCVVFDNAEIGKGTTIGPFTFIQNCKIGNHCAIESNCLVAHHAILGNNCILHAGSFVAGKTTIGKNCSLGFKSSVINKVKVIDNVNIGAFSNVTKDITKPGRYIGTIARYVGDNYEFK